MRLILTALVFVGGLAFALIGLGFLLQPASSGASFGLSASGPTGLAALRADMTAFFVLAGGAMIWGAWRRDGDVLLIPAVLMGIALIGRIVSLIADGPAPGFWQPMVIEAVTIALVLAASRVLPHREPI